MTCSDMRAVTSDDRAQWIEHKKYSVHIVHAPVDRDAYKLLCDSVKHNTKTVVDQKAFT